MTTNNILNFPPLLLTTVAHYAPPHTLPPFLSTCKQINALDNTEFWTSLYYKWYGVQPVVKQTTVKKRCVKLSQGVKEREDYLDELREKELNPTLESKGEEQQSSEESSGKEPEIDNKQQDNDDSDRPYEAEEMDGEGQEGEEAEEDENEYDGHGHGHAHSHEDEEVHRPKDEYEAAGINYWLWATKNGLVRVAESLLRRKRPSGMLLPNIDVVDDRRNTALHIAAMHGDHAMITWLVKNGADIEVRGDQGFTALARAAEKGKAKSVEVLLSLGANINKTVKKAGCTCGLFLDQLLGGASVIKSGATPLWVAACRGQLEVVDLLVANNADIEKPAEGGSTPLYVALRNKHVEVATSLVKAKANINSRAEENGSPITALYAACELNLLEIIKYILEIPGVDVNLANPRGTTPLFIACQNNHLEVVKLLVNAGANVSCRRITGATPILISTIYNHTDVVLYLLEHGAVASDQASDGYTPIYAACENKSLKLVQEFLKAGANPNLQTKGVYPLECVTQNDAYAIIDLLLDSQADTTLLPSKLQTKLHKLQKTNKIHNYQIPERAKRRKV